MLGTAHFRVPRNPWDISIEDGAALDGNVVLLTIG
jgi:hypothetical protein